MEEKAMSTEITSLTTFLESHLTWSSIMSGELATFTLLIVFAVLLAFEFSYPNENCPLNSYASLIKPMPVCLF